jgi:hypothetical protein
MISLDVESGPHTKGAGVVRHACLLCWGFGLAFSSSPKNSKGIGSDFLETSLEMISFVPRESRPHPPCRGPWRDVASSKSPKSSSSIIFD